MYDLPDNLFEKPDRLDVGDPNRDAYQLLATLTASELIDKGSMLLDFQPGNSTRYPLVLALLRDPLCRVWGRGPVALSVVWEGTGRGHLFGVAPETCFAHERYVIEKLGGTVSDGWVLGRFLSVLRAELVEALGIEVRA